MVKVIKRGKLPGERTSRITCGQCRSTLEVKASEWESTGDCREPNAVCVECPVCKHKIYRDRVP
jgi:hypothetical protein